MIRTVSQANSLVACCFTLVSAVLQMWSQGKHWIGQFLMIILANSLACNAADKQLIYRGPGWMIYQENILLKLLLSLYCIGKWPSNAFQCRTVMNTKTKNGDLFCRDLWYFCCDVAALPVIMCFFGYSCVCGAACPDGRSLRLCGSTAACHIVLHPL